MNDASRVGTELNNFIGALYTLLEVFVAGINSHMFEPISISIVLSKMDCFASALKSRPDDPQVWPSRRSGDRLMPLPSKWN